ncbi:molybdopterin converting factor subunit 1 [Bacillus sp. KH172YL63]|uniref:molybdopterin converting factor subunit 1 n=1 Tax=Bacillus sp. KH172YL63 TaxID=2709784 RepID=UPI0013E4BD58|nr:molybdopterin converting factor subunit 1 [Bacillus sp. KH172YL63]BCB02484.1 molybdopterin synthase sulfur carrier subunit [Bacillus sp. KH172YL63]
MITVLLFAHLQEEAGTDKLSLPMDGVTIEELKAELQNTHHLTRLDAVMAAINEEYAGNEDTVQSGDTVALIPPVSGG